MKFKSNVLLIVLVITLCLPVNVFAAVDINQDSTSSFKDIGKYGWAKDAINYFGRSGIMSGDGTGNFLPGQNVTREEFAAMLSNAFNADDDEADQTFYDVPAARWSYKYIESTKEYLTGYYPPKGKPFFDPNGNATREDVAVALAKMLGLTEEDLKDPDILEKLFTDADDVSFNLRGLVSVIIEKKIMVGENNKFRPTDSITRAEVATLLYKVMKGSVAEESQALKLDVDIPETIASKELCISGETVAGAKVKVNGYDAKVDSDGNFEIYFTLKKEGQYSVEIIAVKNGRKAIESGTVVYEESAPKIVLTECPSTSNTPEVTIEGTVSNIDEYSVLTINDKPVQFNRFNYNSGIYTFKYDADLKEDSNSFEFIVTNKNNKKISVTRTIIYNPGAPELTVTECPATSSSKTVTISGILKDPNDSKPTLYINNESVYVDWNGAWSMKFTLQEGKNTYTVKASNSIGKSTTVTREIVFTAGAPELTVTECPATSSSKTVTISGTLKDSNDSSPVLYINNESVYVDWNGSWSKNFTLKEGKNAYVIKASNSIGKSTTVTKEIVFTAGAPELAVLQCPGTSTSKTVTIAGTLRDSNDSKPSLYINNESVYVDWNGSWSKNFTLKEGTNTYTVKAVNNIGKSTEVTREIAFTAGVPEIIFTNCPEVASTKNVTISGKVEEYNDNNVKLYINDQDVGLGYNNEFSKNVALNEGDNTFVFRAVNSYGKSKSVIKTIKYANITAPTLNVDSIPESTQEAIVTISGTVSDTNDSNVTVYVNDKLISSANGSWSAAITLNAGENNLIVTATNEFGKSTTVVKKINYSPVSPEQ